MAAEIVGLFSMVCEIYGVLFNFIIGDRNKYSKRLATWRFSFFKIILKVILRHVRKWKNW